jgi:hypothetical protein
MLPTADNIEIMKRPRLLHSGHTNRSASDHVDLRVFQSDLISERGDEFLLVLGARSVRLIIDGGGLDIVDDVLFRTPRLRTSHE